MHPEGQYDPGDPGADPATPESAPQPAPPDAEPTLAFLEQVLQATGDGEASTRAVPLEELQAVAARWRGQPLSVDPVVTDLVAAALKQMFPTWPLDTPPFREMAASIAQQLHDDRNARARVEKLLEQLAGGV